MRAGASRPSLLGAIESRHAADATQSAQNLLVTGPFATVRVYDGTGNLLTAAGVADAVPTPLSAPAAGQVVVGEPLTIAGRTYRQVAVAVAAGGDQRARLLVDVDMAQLLGKPSDLAFGQTGVKFLVTPTGLVVAGSTAVGTTLRSEVNLAIAAAGRPVTALIYSPFFGRMTVEAYEPVPGQNLGILVQQARTEVMGDADDLAGSLHWAALVVAVLGATLAASLGVFVRRRSRRVAASERRLAETEATSRRRLQQFLDAMPIGVFVATADGYPRYANREAERLLGRGIVPEAGPEDLAEVYQAYTAGTADPYPAAAMPLVRALSGESSHVDDMEIHKPEGTLPVEVWGTPVLGDDRRVEFDITAFADISERRRATREVQFLSAVTANMSEGVVMVRAADSTIAYANASYEAMFGYNPGELLGRNVRDLTAPDFAGSQAVAGILAALRTRGTWQGEIHGLRKNGTPLWCAVNVTALDHPTQGPAWIAVNTDITARREAQEAQARLAAIVQASRDAILGKTLNGTMTSWNPAAEAIFGYTEAEMVGRPVEVLIPPDRLAEEVALRDRVAQGLGIEQHETVRLRKGGTPVDVSATLSPLSDADGRIVGVAAIYRDITDRKRAEQAERRQMARDALVARAVHAMAPATDLRQAFLSFFDAVRSEVAFERASLAVPTGESEVRTLAVAGPEEWRVPQGQSTRIDGERWQRFRAGLSVISRDTATSNAEGVDRELARAGIRSYVSVPILAAGEMRALVSFSSARPDDFPADVVPLSRRSCGRRRGPSTPCSCWTVSARRRLGCASLTPSRASSSARSPMTCARR